MSESPDLFLQQRSMIERMLLAEKYALAKTTAQSYVGQAQHYPDHWNYGNAIHHGNMYVGMCHLALHELEEAKAALLASGKTPGSPQLNSFGPNMLLANRLLLLDETSVVIAFLQLCKTWWQGDLSRANSWIHQIEEGIIPDFKANLFY